MLPVTVAIATADSVCAEIPPRARGAVTTITIFTRPRARTQLLCRAPPVAEYIGKRHVDSHNFGRGNSSPAQYHATIVADNEEHRSTEQADRTADRAPSES
ncbi:hypothetical protein GCM10023318_00450 [Nocardia callitridis]|uniref:Secreted protein n=1 Tax=Nocardia callitridis TaxID=648753 RepID=A0ABP9JRH0_9NOCA